MKGDWASIPVRSGRDNNFNLIRIIAAIAVLVSHAYPLSLGAKATEPLQTPLHGTSLGTVAVYAFFALSGFMIAKSCDNHGTATGFWRARFFRLYPALAVNLWLTILTAAFLINASHVADFWRAVPSWLAGTLGLYRATEGLPGVFAQNPYGAAINGSLWTLFYEVACYAAIFAVMRTRVLRSPAVVGTGLATMLVAFVLVSGDPVGNRLYRLIELGTPFALGSTLYLWRARIGPSLPIALFAAVMGALFAGTQVMALWVMVTVAMFVFWFGFVPVRPLLLYNRLGDYSYGVYIYAFPIQQAVAAIGITSPLANIAIALPVTLIAAVLSWHLVEAPALRWQKGAQA